MYWLSKIVVRLGFDAHFACFWKDCGARDLEFGYFELFSICFKMKLFMKTDAS